jgi:hypothetical protein
MTILYFMVPVAAAIQRHALYVLGYRFFFSYTITLYRRTAESLFAEYSYERDDDKSYRLIGPVRR